MRTDRCIGGGDVCRLCGITLIGENIHFDHGIRWSKGGETVLENLQILCALHNLAKGNLDSADSRIVVSDDVRSHINNLFFVKNNAEAKEDVSKIDLSILKKNNN